MKKERLRSPHSKGWNEHRPSTRSGLVDNRRNCILRILARMPAIAISRFDDQVIRCRDRCRIDHGRTCRAAEIA